jgi:hypothetical protein
MTSATLPQLDMRGRAAVRPRTPQQKGAQTLIYPDHSRIPVRIGLDYLRYTPLFEQTAGATARRISHTGDGQNTDSTLAFGLRHVE